MPLSKEHKAATRERILSRAAALFRRDGVDGVSVPALMKEAGLTHGGFYAHFSSKDALIAEAVERSLSETVDHLVSVARRGDEDGRERVADVIDAYVNPEHRDHPEVGCAVAALGAETSRGEAVVQKAMADGARASAERLGAALGGGDQALDDMLGLYAGMIGAIVLARACRDDEALSDRVIDVCRERLKKTFAA
ncbi:TetR/AcrR family transcriptional regulator [Methylopila turkensis]|uniref:TetR family transcriptional regulator n=1 Tax=Methylopila turkensis TaxID=1437816 RepID=A0A9W6JL49_9HYPH|nr:TetR/AcrR family transcriptional regulator [Methylopila turkensis]GLK79635.1 TetR family transcriptional regulator [Methylopila turkensis]